jgi:twitching motility protein PilJ
MGFISKLSMNFFPKDGGGDAQAPGTVLASPDTQFGAGTMPAGPVSGTAPTGSADDAALRLGQLARRKRRHAEEAATGAAGGDDDLRLPLIGHLSLPRQLRILLVAFGIGILLTLLSLWRNAGSGAIASGQTQIASEAVMHSQRVGKAAPNAMQGVPDAFTQLQDSRIALSHDLDLLAQGGDFNGNAIPASTDDLAAQLAAVRKKWNVSDAAAASILKMKPELVAFDKNLKQLDVLAPEMLALTEEILTERTARGGGARELAALGRMMMLTQRLSRSAGEFLTSGGIRPETAFQMGRDTTTFRVIVDGLLNGSATLGLAPLRDADLRAKLEEVQSKFDICQKLISTFLNKLSDMTAAKAAEQTIFRDNESLRRQLTNLQASYRAGEGSTDMWLWVLVAASIFTLVTAGSISRVMLQDSRNRTRGADARRQEAEAMHLLAQAKEEEAKATNDQNQAAILRLMNELQEVADGDLTVYATVSEDITGAIADSVNYTVEELRGLVVRVIATAEKVTQASDDAQQVSSSLLGAAGRRRARSRTRRPPCSAHGRRDHGRVAVREGIGRGGAPVGGGGGAGRDRGAERDSRHGRDPRADPGNLQAHQAPGRVVAGNRRDHRAHFRHHGTDQRAGAERGHPGRIGRRGGTRLLGRGGRSAAAGGTVGRSGQADRRAGAHHPDRHARRRGGDGKVDAGRRRGRAHDRRGRRGAGRHLARVEPPG